MFIHALLSGRLYDVCMTPLCSSLGYGSVTHPCRCACRWLQTPRTCRCSYYTTVSSTWRTRRSTFPATHCRTFDHLDIVLKPNCTEGIVTDLQRLRTGALRYVSIRTESLVHLLMKFMSYGPKQTLACSQLWKV